MKTETLKSQVKRLAEFIMQECKGYPNQSEGAIDCAIRIIKDLKVFASPNLERVIAFANYFHKEKELMRRTGQMSNGSIMNPRELYQKFFSDLCSGSQETTKDIKLGEVFNVDGKKYAIQKPKTSSEETDPHGTITYYLTDFPKYKL